MWASGAEVLCFGGGLFLAGVAVLSAAGKDAQPGEETRLMAGTSGRVGDAGFSACGVALELEACFGTSGARRKKTKLETDKEIDAGNE
jgi:hypothetical protein